MRRDGDEKRRTSFRRKKASAGAGNPSKNASVNANAGNPWKDQLQAVAARISHDGGARPSGDGRDGAGKRGEGDEDEGKGKTAADTYYDLRSEYPEDAVM